LTYHLDPLQDVFRIYPKAEQTFRGNVRAAFEKGIRAPEFQFKKERILILHHLLTNISTLDSDQIKSLADAVLNRRDMRAIPDLLKSSVKGDKTGASGGLINSAKERLKNSIGMGEEGSSSSWRIVAWGSKSSKHTKEEALWRGANTFASSVSDSEFLMRLKTDVLDECLRDATAEAEETAPACLATMAESLVSSIGEQILSMQKGECDKQIQREVGSAEQRGLRILRSDFVRQIEDITRQRSRSYVHHHILESEDSLTQCSRTSIHVDNFIPKRERYHTQGLLNSPAKLLAYLNEPDRELRYPWATRILAKPRDRISRSPSTPARRAEPQSPARFFFCPNARPE
jgi:hypothetical protein